MSDELQTEQQPVEAVRPIIKAGKLRERVKKGELQAKDVLAWLRQQEGPISEEFVTWLRNFKPNRGKKEEVKEEEVQEAEVPKPRKRFRKGARDGRHTGGRPNQATRGERSRRERKPSEQHRPSGSDHASAKPDQRRKDSDNQSKEQGEVKHS